MGATTAEERRLKEEFQKIISARITQLCDEQQMSNYTLAFKSSMPMTSLMNIINGKSSNPGVYNIMKICDGFGITLSEFFDTKEFEDLIIESRDEK